ncbi:MAG: hypothetical protein AAF361_10055 [Bacteroidota bacterium]
MRKPLAVLIFIFIAFLVLAVAYPGAASEYSAVPQEQEEADHSANEAFDQMMAVLTHKRCVNCHPSDDSPKQGEDSHPHRFGVLRGADNHGMPAVRCNTCHQSENNSFSGVPGAPEWSLAPMSMQWEGLSRTEIAKSMLDRSKNGNRSHEELTHHLTEHELVLWAWEPGLDAEGRPREKPPVSKEAYIAAVKAWFDSGAIIPEE